MKKRGEHFDDLHDIGADEEHDGEEGDTSLSSEMEARVYLWEFNQNDPKRDSGVKLCRMGLATRLKIGRPFNGIVLSADATKVISKEDMSIVQQYGIAGINCSWNRLGEVPVATLGKTRNQRKLPLIYAANTVNYGKACKMNTAEALAAALFIVGYTQDAATLMSSFSYGPEFLRINAGLLEAYEQCKSEREVQNVSTRYLAQLEEAKEEKNKKLEARNEQSLKGGNIGGYMDDMDLPPRDDEEDEGYYEEDDNQQQYV
eukprot:gene37314-45303_t